MKYFFNSLQKIDFKNIKTSYALRLFKFNYINGRIEKKEYKYLVKQIFKNKKKETKSIDKNKHREIN